MAFIFSLSKALSDISYLIVDSKLHFKQIHTIPHHRAAFVIIISHNIQIYADWKIICVNWQIIKKQESRFSPTNISFQNGFTTGKKLFFDIKKSPSGSTSIEYLFSIRNFLVKCGRFWRNRPYIYIYNPV